MRLGTSGLTVGGVAVLAGAAAIAIASSADGRSTSAGVGTPPTATAVPARTVTASRITRFPQTLAPGTAVKSSQLGQRVFVDAKHGFALAAGAQAQYPAATTDGGRTWRTDGPALHVDAAQAPLAVLSVGAANRRTDFFYGGAQAVDVTSDGGRQWWRALFDGLSMAVVVNAEGHLVAFVDASSDATGATGPTWQYVSTDGGRTWRYTTAVGGS
jgi:hypothetical protein